MSDRFEAAVAGAFTALGTIALVVGDTEGRLIGLTAVVLFGGGALAVRAARADAEAEAGPEASPGTEVGTEQPRWLRRARRRHLLPTLVVGLTLVVGAILVFPVAHDQADATAAASGAAAVGALLLLRSAVVLVQVGNRPPTESGVPPPPASGT